MAGTDTLESVAADAAHLGVLDALLFRRVAAGSWAHLGGFGRGRGWAGVVSVEAQDEPVLAEVAEPGQVHLVTHPLVGRVLGPYYAVGGALVRVDRDALVVLGNQTSALAPSATADALRALAAAVSSGVEEVGAAKRLADELEVLHAVRAVTTGTAGDLAGTLQHIVETAAESLSCEVAVLRDAAGHVAATSSWAGVAADDPALDAALTALEERTADGTVCIQDTEVDRLPSPLDRPSGVRSLLAVPMPAPAGGLLVLAHTSAGPRGFTTLCQQLGVQVADAASIVAHTAALRQDLLAVADEQRRTARRDTLTGLGNRLAWDEALATAQQRVDDGGAVTVLTLDVDGLKTVNDSRGHDAGDELLRRCAGVLRELTREDDVVVRIGGDEFAVLLPIDGALARERYETLRARLGTTVSCETGVSASVGVASAGPSTSVADAVREADACMYRAKRDRRSALETVS